MRTHYFDDQLPFPLTQEIVRHIATFFDDNTLFNVMPQVNHAWYALCCSQALLRYKYYRILTLDSNNTVINPYAADRIVLENIHQKLSALDYSQRFFPETWYRLFVLLGETVNTLSPTVKNALGATLTGHLAAVHHAIVTTPSLQQAVTSALRQKKDLTHQLKQDCQQLANRMQQIIQQIPAYRATLKAGDATRLAASLPSLTYAGWDRLGRMINPIVLSDKHIRTLKNVFYSHQKNVAHIVPKIRNALDSVAAAQASDPYQFSEWISPPTLLSDQQKKQLKTVYKNLRKGKKATLKPAVSKALQRAAKQNANVDTTQYEDLIGTLQTFASWESLKNNLTPFLLFPSALNTWKQIYYATRNEGVLTPSKTESIDTTPSYEGDTTHLVRVLDAAKKASIGITTCITKIQNLTQRRAILLPQNNVLVLAVEWYVTQMHVCLERLNAALDAHSNAVLSQNDHIILITQFYQTLAYRLNALSRHGNDRIPEGPGMSLFFQMRETILAHLPSIETNIHTNLPLITLLLIQLNIQEGDKWYQKQDVNAAMQYYGQAAIHQQSIEWPQTVLQQHKGTLVDTYMGQVICCKELNDYTSALTALNKALHIDPTNPGLHSLQAQTYYLLNDWKKAEIAFQLFFKMDPNRLPSLRGQRAQALYYLQNIAQQSHAYVAYMVVDLQLTDCGEIKILAVDRGMQSPVAGYYQLPNNNLKTHQKKLHDGVKQISPHWKAVCFTTSPGIDAFHRKNFNALVTEIKSQPTPLTANKGQLSHYPGLVFAGNKIPKVPDNTLLAEGHLPFHLLANNKQWMHEAFEESAKEYRPRCRLLPLHYTPNLAQEIQQSMPSDYYVLKTLDGAHGQGHRLTTKENLDETLQSFCKEEAGRSNSPHCLVEEYVPSKIVITNKQSYRGTIRASFLLYRDAGVLRFKLIDSYWKLPQQPITGQDLEARSLTSAIKGHTRSAPVAPQDQSVVWEQLKPAMLTLFGNALKKDYPTHAMKLLNSDKRIDQQQGCHLITHIATISVQLNHVELAEYCLNLAQKTRPNDYRSYHTRGVLMHRQGNYQEAVVQFERALALGHQNTTRYRSALSYIMLEEYAKAERILNTLRASFPEDPYYLEAHDLLTLWRDKKSLVQHQINALQTTAMAALNAKKYTEAQSLLTQCKDGYQRLEDWSLMAKMVGNIGICYYAQKAYSKAFSAFQEALTLMSAHQIQAPQRKATLQLNLAHTFVALKHDEKAIPLLVSCIQQGRLLTLNNTAKAEALLQDIAPQHALLHSKTISSPTIGQ